MWKGARKMMALTLVLGALAAVPAQAMAQECVEVFERCLNDTWDTEGLTRLLANIECTAKYVSCIKNMV